MANKQHITLLELQTIIKNRLEQAMPLPCWVTAEISELKVNYSGHCYLELVEKGGKNQVPKAKASAVIWRSAFGAISSYFKSETGNELAAGMSVLMKVSVSYHELYGLSFVVSDIDPLYTLGDMERQRQQTIGQLQSEGVFDMNRSLDLPTPTQRIAVVSSRNAAGYQDFMNELASSGYHFDISLFDSFMQGHAVEDSLIEALERVAQEMERFDVVVVIRGGGSQSDLAAFDAYRICSHIAQFPLPVLTGIGHHKDQSVADMVAYQALKTPTAVAGYLIDNLARFDDWLDNAYDEITSKAVSIIDQERDWIRMAGLTISRTATDMTHDLDMRLQKIAGELSLKVQASVISHRNSLSILQSEIKNKISTTLSARNHKLDSALQLIQSRHPDKILSLGFAVVRKNGKAVTDVDSLGIGDQLDIDLAKGSVKADVKNIKKI